MWQRTRHHSEEETWRHVGVSRDEVICSLRSSDVLALLFYRSAVHHEHRSSKHREKETKTMWGWSWSGLCWSAATQQKQSFLVEFSLCWSSSIKLESSELIRPPSQHHGQRQSSSRAQSLVHCGDRALQSTLLLSLHYWTSVTVTQSISTYLCHHISLLCFIAVLHLKTNSLHFVYFSSGLLRCSLVTDELLCRLCDAADKQISPSIHSCFFSAGREELHQVVMYSQSSHCTFVNTAAGGQPRNINVTSLFIEYCFLHSRSDSHHLLWDVKVWEWSLLLDFPSITCEDAAQNWSVLIWLVKMTPHHTAPSPLWAVTSRSGSFTVKLQILCGTCTLML